MEATAACVQSCFVAAEAHGEEAVLPFFPQENGEVPYVCACDFILGAASKHEFQAETKKLLDIVARSLYSEKEVGHLYLPQSWQIFCC